MIGTTLGPYEIVDKLGAGGMGEVWRARDTKLEREVAIKLLPDDFADDPERLARFEREAKLLASLNHANIASIYDLDDADGKRFIAMELVEGESLAERMEAGRIALDDALETARQIAAALEAAHDNGVIHRDLKPANIMVTPAGEVKVLDFGLAKAYAPDGSPSDISPDISNSPTIVNATRSGMIVGTAAYMSPEQAAGAAVDNRTDIWAFGVVLYEMLSGGRLFHGESAAHVLADVLKTEPDRDRLAPETPAEIHRLVRRCLHKKADRRLHHIADARLVIEEVIAGTEDEGLPEAAAWVAGSSAGQGAAAGRGLALSLPRAAILATVALLAGVTGSWWYTSASARAPEPLTVFDVAGDLAVVHMMAISPDGETLVIAGAQEAAGERGLYIRHLGDNALVPLPGTEGAQRPFFSHDGAWIGFWTGGLQSGFALRKVSIEGVVLDIHTFEDFAGDGSWGADETILFATSNGISRIPASAGPVDVVVESEDFSNYQDPQALPGGRVMLQFVQRSTEGFRADIAVYSAVDDTIEVLVEDGDTPVFVPPDNLFFGRGGSVWLVKYDPAGVTVSPTPTLVRQGIRAHSGSTFYDVARDGTLVFVPGTFLRTNFSGRPESRLVTVDPEGNETERLGVVTDTQSLSLSRDGRRIAISRGARGRQVIHVYDMVTEAGEPLPPAAENNDNPHWSADGWVYFLANDGDSRPRIFRVRPGVAGVDPEPLGEGFILDVSPRDGRVLYTVRGGVDLALMSPDNESAPEVLLDTDQDVLSAQFSPDGTLIAYVANDTDDRTNVYVRDVDTRIRIPVSPRGGAGPVWSADGQELVFVAGDIIFRVGDEGGWSISSGDPDLTLRRVRVRVVDGSPEPDAPEPYFTGGDPAGLRLFFLVGDGPEITPDGALLFPKSDQAVAIEEAMVNDTVTVVRNWLRNFERR